MVAGGKLTLPAPLHKISSRSLLRGTGLCCSAAFSQKEREKAESMSETVSQHGGLASQRGSVLDITAPGDVPPISEEGNLDNTCESTAFSTARTGFSYAVIRECSQLPC